MHLQKYKTMPNILTESNKRKASLGDEKLAESRLLSLMIAIIPGPVSTNKEKKFIYARVIINYACGTLVANT